MGVAAGKDEPRTLPTMGATDANVVRIAVHPALNDGRSNPAALTDGWSMATPRAASTALMAEMLLMFIRLRVNTADDAMSCR